MDSSNNKKIFGILLLVFVVVIIFLFNYFKNPTYVLTIKYNNSFEDEIIKLKENEKYTLDEITKDGYFFDRWKVEGKGSKVEDNIFIMGNEDATVSAVWGDELYKITYDLNGGTQSNKAISSYTSVSETFKLSIPFKKGYDFEGWYTDKAFTSTSVKEVEKGSKGNIDFYAKWSPIVYNVSYELNGGSVYSEMVTSYTIETETFKLANPVRQNYVFLGWSSDDLKKAEQSVVVEKGNIGNRVYVANWKPISYKINYNLNGGSLNNPLTSYTIESKTFSLPIPSKKGYDFKGWYIDESLVGEEIKQIEKGTFGDREYFAKWEMATYTIDYETNGGVIADEVLEYNIYTDTFSLPFPKKEGYIFKGWYDNKKYNNSPYNEVKKGSAGNITFYAKWAKFKEEKNKKLYDIITSEKVYDNKMSDFVSSEKGIDYLYPSSITNGNGIYVMSESKDDNFPVYYYRGYILDNNVYFANYCWKILRTTEKGGIRLLFNGVKNANGTCDNTSYDTLIGTGVHFNPGTIGVAGAGYSYTNKTLLVLKGKNDKTVTVGTVFAHDINYDANTGKYTLIGDKVVSSSNFTAEKNDLLKEHHYTCFSATSDTCTEVYYVYMGRDKQIFYAILKDGKYLDDLMKVEFEGGSTNATKSTLQKFVDDWYKTNMVAYTDDLEDSVYCNDRSLYNPWNSSSSIANDNLLKLHFATKGRTAYSGKVTLKCLHKADRFTVDSKNGNGALDYPAALITYDEAVLAGMSWNGSNKDSYIYNERVYWTMSPGFISATGIYNGVITSGLDHVAVNYTGNQTSAGSGIYTAGGMRPVITLKHDAIVLNGDGSVNNPYVIK